jgi:hypothetical protein
MNIGARYGAAVDEDALTRIRSSCLSLLAGNECPVRVDLEAAASFGRSLRDLIMADASLVADGVDFPLVLDSEDEIVDLTVFSALLAFGSGYRVPLHAAVGAGASDTMIRGVLRFYLEGKKPSAAVLVHARLADVAETFGIPLSVDKPAGAHLPGVSISAPGPLRPLAESIQRALSSSGAVLSASGATSFSDYLRARADEWHDAETGAPLAAPFVALLAAAFPAFRDESAPGAAARVCFYKKAQLAVKELARKFPGHAVWGFSAQETARLSAFADNVIPAVLRARGALVYADALAARVDAGAPLASALGEDAPLRAGAVVAVDALAAAAGVTAAVAEGALWRLGKTPEFRALQRHVSTDTVFY